MKDRRKYILLALLTALIVFASPVDSTQADDDPSVKVEDTSTGQDSVDNPVAEPGEAKDVQSEPKVAGKPKIKTKKPFRFKPKAPGANNLLWKMLASVVVIGVLAGVAYFVLRRLGSKLKITPGRKIKLVETLSLGPGRSLHLVEIESSKILLSSTKTGVTMLTKLGDDPEDGGAKFPSRQELEAMGSE